MFHNFSGQTADDVWLAIADTFLNGGHSEARPVAQSSRAGDTHELLHATLSIEDPRQRWVTAGEPAINPSFALAEVIWILGGRNDSAFLTYFNRQLPQFAGEGPTFHGAYGHRLRKRTSFDQLERAYFALNGSPESRQVVLQIWDAEIDFPLADGRPAAPGYTVQCAINAQGQTGKVGMGADTAEQRHLPRPAVQHRPVHVATGGNGRLARIGAWQLQPHERQPSPLRCRFSIVVAQACFGRREEHRRPPPAEVGLGTRDGGAIRASVSRG